MSEKCQSILRVHGRISAQVATLSYEFEKAHVIAEHYHPEHQLVFASRGVMRVRTQEDLWIVPPLRAVWIPAGTPHSVETVGPLSMRTLYLLPKLVRSVPTKCFVMNVSPLLRELILHACTFCKLRQGNSIHRRIIEILLDQFKAARSIPLQLRKPTDSRGARVVELLFADPSDPRSLEQLCVQCGAGKRTIQRLFIAQTGMTFGQWRRQLRLLHALQSLACGEKVTAAAMDAGYSSASAFISMFRKHMGETPSRYFQGS
jgi:AraC-like DNA-binding protein/quercetin dioxygenase-like cupin family protein